MSFHSLGWDLANSKHEQKQKLILDELGKLEVPMSVKRMVFKVPKTLLLAASVLIGIRAEFTGSLTRHDQAALGECDDKRNHG